MRRVIGICEKCLNFGRPCPGLTTAVRNALRLSNICYIKSTGDEDKDAEKRITLELERLVTQMMQLQDREDKLHGKLAKVRARILLREEEDPFPYKKFFLKGDV